MFDLSSLVLRLVEETENLGEIEEKIAKLVFELGRWICQAVFSHLDRRLARQREKGLRMVGTRERDVLTRFGTVRIKRRYYRDSEGRYRFLLDEVLGWEKGGLAATPALEAQALEMCSQVSYRSAFKAHLLLPGRASEAFPALSPGTAKGEAEDRGEEQAGPRSLLPGRPASLQGKGSKEAFP